VQYTGYSLVAVQYTGHSCTKHALLFRCWSS
jgi:hypothetical protein